MISLSSYSDFGHQGQYVALITGRNTSYTFERTFVGRKTGKRNEISEAHVDEPGLYECCNVGKKGKSSIFYLVLNFGDTLDKLDIDRKDAMYIAKEMDKGRKLTDIVIGIPLNEEAFDIHQNLKTLTFHKIWHPSQNQLNSSVTLNCDIGPYKKGSKVLQSILQPMIDSEKERLENILSNLNDEGKYEDLRFEIISEKKAEMIQKAQTTESAIKECWEIIQPLPEKEAKKVLTTLRKMLSPKN